MRCRIAQPLIMEHCGVDVESKGPSVLHTRMSEIVLFWGFLALWGFMGFNVSGRNAK